MKDILDDIDKKTIDGELLSLNHYKPNMYIASKHAEFKKKHMMIKKDCKEHC